MQNNLFFSNLKGITRMLVPEFLLPKNRQKFLQNLKQRADFELIKKRVDYYCPLNSKIKLDSDAWQLRALRFTRKNTAYFFDSYEIARYFPQNFKAHFEFGDVYYLCAKPSFTKSRLILNAEGGNTTTLFC